MWFGGWGRGGRGSAPSLAQRYRSRLQFAEPETLTAIVNGDFSGFVFPHQHATLGSTGCLQARSGENNLRFEVIVVDDGSKEPVPDHVQRWSGSYPLTVVRQDHAGISAAKNHGIQCSMGEILLFVEADSRVGLLGGAGIRN